MNQRKSLLSIILVLCMLFQSIVPVFARLDEGGGGSVSDAKAQFEENYKKIMALKPIDLGLIGTGAVGLASGLHNAGTWLGNTFGGKNDEYVDYVGEIKKANQEIENAQKQARQMKAEFDKAKLGEVEKMDPSKLEKGPLTTQQNAQVKNQETLKQAGETLKKVGDIVNTVGTVLGIVDPILKMVSIAATVPPVTALGAACGAAWPFVHALALGLPVVGSTLKGAGQGLCDAANIAVQSDEALYNITHGQEDKNPKNMSVSGTVALGAVKEGAPAALFAFLGSEKGGEIAKNTVGKLGTAFQGTKLGQKVAGTSVAQKYFNGDIAKALKDGWGYEWNPKKLTAEVLKDNYSGYAISKGLAADKVDDFFKYAGKAADKIDSFLYKKATGESLPTINLKQGFKKGVSGISNAVYDHFKPKAPEDNAGLNADSDFGGGGGGGGGRAF